MKAVYVFDRTLAGPGGGALLARAADAGIDTLVTKAAAVTDGLAARCRRLGLAVFGSVSCFSDHAEPPERRRPDLRPVGVHGLPWQPMEWYTGLVPTDGGYVDGLVDRCADLAAGPVDGLILDFIRWPLHWELELREDATPRRSSFDRTTLAAFQAWSGAELPMTAATAAHVLLHEMRPQWTEFRCAVITEVVRRIADRVRPARPLAAFVVPADDDAARRDLVGQAVADWTPWLDMVLPMTYHAMLRRPPSLVAERAASIAAAFGGPVVPVVQATADPAVARGADWGPPIPEHDFASALGHAAAMGDGWCIFPGEGVDEPRWRLVARKTTTRGRNHDE